MEISLTHNRLIQILSPKPGIKIWHAKISEITSDLLYSSCHLEPLTGRRNIKFKPDDLKTPCFNETEFKIINNFKALKKQIEWMSGRYIIKQLIQKKFLQKEPLQNIEILYRRKGSPFIANHPDISISISHSNDITAAACSMNENQTIGMDVERIGNRPDNAFLKTAFTIRERQFLKKDAPSIFLNWTIKEAYLKYIKLGFHESLHKVEIVNNEIWHDQKKIKLDVFSKQILKDYIISLVSD